jgi:hypothetical protein
MTVLGASLVGQMVNETSNTSLGTAATSRGEKLPSKMSSVLGIPVEIESIGKDNVTAGIKIDKTTANNRIIASIDFFFN